MVTYPNTAPDLFLKFVQAFEKADETSMRALLTEDVVMSITNGSGGVDTVSGLDPLIARFQTIPYEKVHFGLEVTQVASISAEEILGMVHVTAQSKGENLQNFAAFLCHLRHGKFDRIWMVEAEPQKSDAFWKSI